MKFITLNIGMLILLLLTSCTKSAWEKALEENTIEAYKAYIAADSTAEFVARARFLVDSLMEAKDISDWQTALTANTPDAYKAYLSANPEGTYVEPATKNLKSLLDIEGEKNLWDSVQQLKTFELYETYVNTYSAGIHINEATTQYRKLLYEKLNNEYAGVLTFFSSDIPYSDYLSKKKCTINGIKVRFPISESFHTEQGLWELVNKRSLMDSLLTMHFENQPVEGTISFILDTKVVQLDMNIFTDGFGFTFNFVFTKEKQDWFISELNISLPSYM